MNEYLVYAQFDFICLLIMIIVGVRTITLSRELAYQKVYLLMMLFAICLVGSDMIYEFSMGLEWNVPGFFLYAINIIYFIASILISHSWFFYTQLVTGTNCNKHPYIVTLLSIPALFLVIASLFTYHSHWVFYFDADGYHRGSLNSLYMIVPLVYIMGAVGIAMFNAVTKKEKKSREHLITVVSFAVFPVISVAIQSRLIGFPAVCVGCMLGMLQVFLYDIVRDREILLIAETETRSKNNFFAGMSHELRTPINAILGMNTMILREAENETVRGYATNVETSGKLLLTLVNDILDISKIEAGKMELLVGEVDIKTLILDLYRMIEPRMKEKSLDFKLDIDPMLPMTISGDEVRIRQIILNMLTNAVKYTIEGSVTLSVKSDNRHDNEADITFSVSDTGRGMKSEDIENLFKPYERIDEKSNRKIEGTGLGMSICKLLLELMGSEMKVESTPGKGSTFFFTMRVPVVNIRPINEVDITSIVNENKVAKPKKYQSKFTAPDARILAVDDTIVNLKVFKALLKTTQMTIDTVASGREALEIAKIFDYDMIFIDIMMPDLDGVETLLGLMSEDNLVKGNTPIIALTANALSGAREEYLGVGFMDYLSKPIEVDELENVIIKYLPPDMITYTQ